MVASAAQSCKAVAASNVSAMDVALCYQVHKMSHKSADLGCPSFWRLFDAITSGLLKYKVCVVFLSAMVIAFAE